MLYKKNLRRLFVIIITGVIAAVTTSCHNQEIEAEGTRSSSNEIGLSSVVETEQTKGGIITSDNISSLGIFAYTSDNSSIASGYTGYSRAKMHNAHYSNINVRGGIFEMVEPQPDGSTCDNIWSEDYHHFYGYAPFGIAEISFVNRDDTTIAASHTDNAPPALKYWVTSNNPAEHNDLLYATAVNCLQPISATGSINLTYNHALSKISFSAQHHSSLSDVNKEKPITVTSVDMINIAQSGVLKFQNEFNTSSPKAVWSEVGDNEGYSFDVPASAQNIIYNSTNPQPQLLFGGDEDSSNPLFLLPQSHDGKSSFLAIEYTFDGKDVRKVLAIPATNWGMGQSYHYILNINPEKDLIEITAQVIDWRNSYDIVSEVTYTYLYLEKDTYTLNYEEGKPRELTINFSTNATDVSIEHLIKDYTPSSTVINLDVANQAINCTFYPSDTYKTDSIRITAGIVSTKIAINFALVEVVDFTDNIEVAEILGISQDPAPALVTSNCYIIDPTRTATTEYYIPIYEQIHRFHGWTHNSNVGTMPSDFDIDNWGVATYAYDNVATVNRVTYEKIADRNGYPAIKVTIPANYGNPGNIIVAVTDERESTNKGKILWCWHIWLTDYNPYEILKSGTAVTNSRKYNSTGSVYRFMSYDYSCHLDRNIGAYALEPIGQGGLGGRGWLSYQYGRPMPIFGHQARMADGSSYQTDKLDVTNAQVTLLHSIANPKTVYYNTTGGNWCSATDVEGQVWNDPDELMQGSVTDKVYKKSIFDPSPLGWMIPPLLEYSTAGWSIKAGTNGHTYLTSSKNEFHSTVNIDPSTGFANIVVLDHTLMWTNTDVPSGSTIPDENTPPTTSVPNPTITTTVNRAAGLRFDNYVTTPNVSHKYDANHTLGASIRPIFQFQMSGSF